MKPGTVETPASLASFLDSILSPMAAIARTLGPIKRYPGLRQCGGESLAFGQKAITGMDGLRPGIAGRFHDLGDLEIGLRGRGRPHINRLVRHFDMQGVAVRVRIDRHGGNAHPAGGLDDAAGNLATIGDQNLLKQSSPRFARPGGFVPGQ